MHSGSSARILMLMLALALGACQREPATPQGPDAVGQLQGATEDQVVLVASTDGPGWPADLVSITAARMDAPDTLRLDVQYGGGCATHRLRLLVGEAFMESSPVQVRSRLSHDAGGDRCRALVQRTLRVDLGALRQRYQAAYQTTTGSIRILLTGAPEPIAYSF